MKTGMVLVRLLACVPAVAGICLMQGCSTSKGSKPAVEVAPVPLPEPVVAPTVIVITNRVKVEPPAPVVLEKPVLKPVPAITTPYTVKDGEGIIDIAVKYGKRWQDVLAVNPELSLKSHLRKGQTIQLPSPVDLAHPKVVHKKVKKPAPVEKKPAAPVEAKPVDAAAAAAPAAGEATYTVKKNDSVATIAAAHHVKRADLMTVNNLTAKSVLQIGQKLVIPAKADAAAPAAEAAAPAAAPVAAPVDASTVPPPPDAAPAAGMSPAVGAAAPGAGTVAPAAARPAPAPESKAYTVKEGEDVYAVAIRWGVSPAELKALNNLSTSDLQAGQVLKIPVVAAPAP
ncbi:MAG: LysM peptidoglycan-binding domain-containing protein [Kiritimatiellia bacterium]